MKKITMSILLTMLLCITGGCWDRREINEVSLVSGLAIDKGKQKKYKVSMEVLNASELNPKTGGQSTPTILFALEGNTIAELAQQMNIGMSRRFIYSHMRTLVISEKVGKEGITDFLDYLENSRELRDDFNILIAKGVPASDILSIPYPLEKSPANKLHVQLKTLVKEWGGDPDVQLNDLMGAVISKGREPTLAAVTIAGSDQKGKSADNIKKPVPDAIVKLAGSAVFKKEKLLGYITVQDTRNYLWTQNKLTLTSVSTPCKKNKYITVRLYNTDSKIKAYYLHEKPHIDVLVSAEGRLYGTQCADDMEQEETYHKYEQLLKTSIEKRIKRTITKVQTEFGADIFGFGEKMYRQNDQQFKKVETNWNREFTRAEINVKATIKLRRRELKTTPYQKAVP